METEQLRQQLVERIIKNFADYQAELLLKERQELINGAEQIAATINAYDYLSEFDWCDDTALKHYLKFQNPLEVLTDRWIDEMRDFRSNIQEIQKVSSILEPNEGDLTQYPLITDRKPAKETMRKFLNVDIDQSLQALMEQITITHKTDLTYALNEIHRGCTLESAEERNFVLLFRKSGVECLKERDIFIGSNYGQDSTSSYNTLQFFCTGTSNPVLAYSVEVSGIEKGRLRGNLYERDIHRLGEYAKQMASPYTYVTLTFATGKELQLPQKEYNYNPNTVKRLAYQNGKLVKVLNIAEDESVVQGALQREHMRRNRLPAGRFKVHIQKLADQFMEQKRKEDKQEGKRSIKEQLSKQPVSSVSVIKKEKEREER